MSDEQLRTPAIDEDRLAMRIEELGRVGQHPDGGLYRALYEPSWNEAMDLVERWMQDGGLHTYRDAVGNLYGRLEGVESTRSIVSGSHIDTVKQGGAYDGALGIHAALEAVLSLQSTFGRPRQHLEVLVTCEEEGSRFQSDFWGARAITAGIAPDDVDRIVALDGTAEPLREAMQRQGLDPNATGNAARTDIDAFIELHIEQGRVLEEEHRTVAIVEAITGQVHLLVTVTGRQDHAGTTPMDLREDAFAAAADMAGRIERCARTMGRPAVATVGSVVVQPDAINVIPGQVVFTVDFRHPDADVLRDMDAQIRADIAAVQAERPVGCHIETLMDHRPVPMDPTLIELLGRASDEVVGYRFPMPSGAGHDAQVMARAIPTGMIFVPSTDGLSHTPREHTPLDDLVPGIRVLATALHALAY